MAEWLLGGSTAEHEHEIQTLVKRMEQGHKRLEAPASGSPLERNGNKHYTQGRISHERREELVAMLGQDPDLGEVLLALQRVVTGTHGV